MNRFLVVFAVTLALAAPLWADWSRDFAAQPVAARPKLEARYEDARRVGFVVEAQAYRLTLDLQTDRGQGIRSLVVNGRNVLGPGGAWLEAVTQGRAYTCRQSKEPSRVNIYRRGPYTIEVHWLDVALANKQGDELPIKGEVVFHCYPEKVHVSALFHVTGDTPVSRAGLVTAIPAGAPPLFPGKRVKPGELLPVSQRTVLRLAGGLAMLWPAPGSAAGLMQQADPAGLRLEQAVAAERWSPGRVPTTHVEWLPFPAGTAGAALIETELQPLTTLTAAKGTALGYDPVRGCYRVRTDNTGGFSYHYYENRNDYETARFSITNGLLPRKVYVCHDTGQYPGSVECGVLLDEWGGLLPVTVQISKNFAGEKEEKFYNPQDTPFSETYFPLYLGPNETRRLTSLHLYQDWGNHPLKQFSSLGAWMDYYHMSTGVTETTCYVPFKFGGLPGVDIADLRAMSGTMWTSQPQHDNVAGHSFLRYNDGKWHYSEYLGTTFHSTGPNWAHVTLRQRSDDGKVDCTLDIFELPQADELRNFIHLRYDFRQSLTIKRAGENLRLLNIITAIQGIRYQQVGWSSTGGPQARPIAFDDTFTLAGQPLAGSAPWAAVYAAKQGNNAFVVRRWQACLGGRADSGPAVSVYGGKDRNTTLMLVPAAGDLAIQAGDFIDVDLFIMPYGTEKNDWHDAAREAERFGAKAPRVLGVGRGRKLGDFPTRLRADAGAAEATIEGGAAVIPIILEGCKTYERPKLLRRQGQDWVEVPHQRLGGDGYQVFVGEDGTFGAVFLLPTDGGRQTVRAEMGAKIKIRL